MATKRLGRAMSDQREILALAQEILDEPAKARRSKQEERHVERFGEVVRLLNESRPRCLGALHALLAAITGRFGTDVLTLGDPVWVRHWDHEESENHHLLEVVVDELRDFTPRTYELVESILEVPSRLGLQAPVLELAGVSLSGSATVLPHYLGDRCQGLILRKARISTELQFAKAVVTLLESKS